MRFALRFALGFAGRVVNRSARLRRSGWRHTSGDDVFRPWRWGPA